MAIANLKASKGKVSASQCKEIYFETKTRAKEVKDVNIHLTQNSGQFTQRAGEQGRSNTLSIWKETWNWREVEPILGTSPVSVQYISCMRCSENRRKLFTATLMSANRSYTSIDSLPAETSQTVQSRYYKYNISKLIWHLCKIWQSYPINCFDHDAAVTDNASSTSSAQSSLHASLWARASQYPQHRPAAVTSPITHYRSVQKRPKALWNLKERSLPVKHQQKMSSY